MANRALQQKAARAKSQREAWQLSLPMPMPEHKHSNDHLIAQYEGKIRRIPCKGKMPEKSYGYTIKSRTRQGLALWTGGKGAGEKVIPSRPQPSAIDWTPTRETYAKSLGLK